MFDISALFNPTNTLTENDDGLCNDSSTSCPLSHSWQCLSFFVALRRKIVKQREDARRSLKACNNAPDSKGEIGTSLWPKFFQHLNASGAKVSDNSRTCWRCRGLNPGPHTCKACALPLSYIPIPSIAIVTREMKRAYQVLRTKCLFDKDSEL